jgi:hypothetical protein
MKFRKQLLVIFLFILPATGARAQFNEGDMASSLQEAMTFTKYPTYAQYVEMMLAFASDYPGICTLDTFGTTPGGRLLLAVKISDNPGLEEAEAGFLYTSSMHGDELVGYPLMLRLIHYLLTAYGEDSRVRGLVDSLAIWINPLANPDGTYSGGDQTVTGATRMNASGSDLNRTFPNIGKGEPDDTTGRPPENRDMMVFLRQHRFSLSANLHAGAELVNYPWDWKEERHPDDDWFRLISGEYTDEVHSVDPEYMMMMDDGITNGYDWYEIGGSRQDYVTHYLGGREVTLELSFDPFLDSDSLESFWQKNIQSFLYYMTQATYGIRGRVTDAVSGDPLAARISIDGHDDETSAVSSHPAHGDFYRLIKGGLYDVTFSAEGHLSRTITGVDVADYQAVYLDVALDPWFDRTTPGQLLPGFRIWPNPVSDVLHVAFMGTSGLPVRLEVLSADGRVRRTQSCPAGTGSCTFSTEELSHGIYFLKLVSGDHISIQPFIRQ